MDKGTRVDITGGRQGKGKSGTIFWKGENKYGPGNRFGVRGDDGETYWVVEDDVQESDKAAPEVPTSDVTYSKGDRVELEKGGQVVYGEVFWTGASKIGGGQRLGLKNEADGETIWIDAGYVKPATGSAPPSTSSAVSYSDDPREDEPYVAPVALGDMPPPAPIDDAQFDQWAAAEDDDDEPPPMD